MGLRNLAQHSFVPSSQLRAAVRNEGDFLQVLAQLLLRQQLDTMEKKKHWLLKTILY